MTPCWSCCQYWQQRPTLAGVEGTKRTAASLLREIREAQGRSLRAVADEVGVAPSYLSRVERGQRSLTPEMGERMAVCYGVEAELLDLAEGRVPADVLLILQQHPDVLMQLRSSYRAADSGPHGD